MFVILFFIDITIDRIEPMELIGSTKKKILMEISREPCHGYKLALTLTLPLSTVYGHLQDLKKLGLIDSKVNDRQIIYKLTEKGKLFVKVIQ
jgi:predicted transcriptional regulator